MPNFGNWCCATHTQIQSLDCPRTTSIHPQRHDSTESSQKRSCKLHPDFVCSGKATRLTQCIPNLANSDCASVFFGKFVENFWFEVMRNSNFVASNSYRHLMDRQLTPENKAGVNKSWPFYPLVEDHQQPFERVTYPRKGYKDLPGTWYSILYLIVIWCGKTNRKQLKYLKYEWKLLCYGWGFLRKTHWMPWKFVKLGPRNPPEIQQEAIMGHPPLHSRCLVIGPFIK